MNKVFIKMLTVSALSVTMLFGASFATTENMTELNPSISIEDGSDFIVINGNEYISTDKLSEIGISITLDQSKIMIGEQNKTYKIGVFGSNEAIKFKNKIYLPFKDVMSENGISFEYTTSDTMVVTNGASTFAMYAKKEEAPYTKIMDNASTNYTKLENTAVKVENLTEAMKITIANKTEEEKRYAEKIKAENLTEAAKIALAKKIKAEKLVQANEILEGKSTKIVNKDSLVKFQNTVYIYSKEIRNLNVETTKANDVITVLNTKNDNTVDLTIKDIMYTSGQGGSDCLLPAVRVLDELEIDYTIDYDNAKIEVRNLDGQVYYTFE